MLKLFKRDNVFLGIALGLILPGILFGLLYLLNDLLSDKTRTGEPPVSLSTLGLISIFLNMFIMRMYLVRWKMDKTGRGILAVTFILGILYVIFLFK